MATKLSTIEFLVEQLHGVGDVAYKKMFGEYVVYLNTKPVFLICDDTLFVKDIPELQELLKGCDKVPPYTGARPHFVIDNVDDREFLVEVAQILEKVLPFPRKKK